MKTRRFILGHFLFLFIIALFFKPTNVHAEADSVIHEDRMIQPVTNEGSATNDKNIRIKVKTRAYPGGRDEEPLRVQAQLPSPSRKMQPAQEPMEQSEPPANDSTDYTNSND